ncbi:carboxypeptidase regulatory-like domain-containing protein [Streptomyces canus]|uniref:dioxygenase family protein n=1 Tax=Streptomyces canus TaxID=58343 RepID=UPI0022520C88|nr:dioxygenase [Streptomyces canus]MCX4853200.1 carboxypeptidase regulatory-like domain-containing protein [Streptomyces canus]WSW31590.1 carboxypeptidase regulatory-like domain-containing protein [Streptomyces canus]
MTELTELTEQELTDKVVASFDTAKDERFREVMQALVRHAHAFVRETRLTEEEWGAAIEFLTAAGHITTDTRQEFVLLSDVLGISMLTVAVNEPDPGESTESTVLGPFFVQDSPEIELGGDITGGASGEPSWVSGRVTDTEGTPVAGARVEVWEADDGGMYDVQYDDGALAGRAHLFTDAEGRFRFWGLTPTPYPIPDDGPVGRLLGHAGRSPMRAPHLHFMVTAPGFRRLITHIFVAGDPCLDADSVFGVKESLIRPFDRHEAGTPTPDSRPLEGPWTATTFDIVLGKE